MLGPSCQLHQAASAEACFTSMGAGCVQCPAGSVPTVLSRWTAGGLRHSVLRQEHFSPWELQALHEFQLIQSSGLCKLLSCCIEKQTGLLKLSQEVFSFAKVIN